MDEELRAKLIEEEILLFEKNILPEIEAEWPIPEKRPHRHSIKELTTIQNIKNEMIELLHPFAIKIFLLFYGNFKETDGPYLNLEKGICILYQQLQGLANTELPIPEKTFWSIQDKFWSHEKEIDFWCKSWFKKLSNYKVRLLHAKLYNPPRFKNVTLLVDGKDVIQKLNKIKNEYRETVNGKSNLISRKNSWKNGGKQQEIMDVRNMTLGLSNTLGCNEIYDGHQFKDLIENYDNVEEVFNPTSDCLSMDNHFVKNAKEFIDENSHLGYSKKNLCLPISKIKNRKLTKDELDYKNDYGAMRSYQESEKFGIFTKIFKRFSVHNKKQTSNFKNFNVQLSLCLVLFNISNYISKNSYLNEKYDHIDITDWCKSGFDYPNEQVEIVTERIIEINSNIDEMNTSQNDVLNERDILIQS